MKNFTLLCVRTSIVMPCRALWGCMWM